MRAFIIALAFVCTACQSEKPKDSPSREPQDNILRASTAEPESLDPRKIRSVTGHTIALALYDGLTGYDQRGNLINTLADSINVSSDHKVWTITLRKAYWSNGDRITATDFKESWLTALSPSFPAPNAYQLFMIKGAERYKSGIVDASSVALYTPSEDTLVVELSQPTPYFPEMLANTFMFAVHSSLREGETTNNELVSSGPFMLTKWEFNKEIDLVRNPLYWDSDAVKLDGVKFCIIDDQTALSLFNGDELDWTGSPSGQVPVDAIDSLAAQQELVEHPTAATTFFRVNTTRPLLRNKHFRQALSLALDRETIANQVHHCRQIAASGLVPPVLHRDAPKNVVLAFDPLTAWQLMDLALEEEELDRNTLTPVKILYKFSEANHKTAQAVQQQWQKALGIPFVLEHSEGGAIFERWERGDFELTLGSWFADFRDPVNFLDIFRSAATPVNHTGWENPRYKILLDVSQRQLGATRLNTLREAENLLLEEAPIIPIYHNKMLAAKRVNISGARISEISRLDLKYASFNDLDQEQD